MMLRSNPNLAGLILLAALSGGLCQARTAHIAVKGASFAVRADDNGNGPDGAADAATGTVALQGSVTATDNAVPHSQEGDDRLSRAEEAFNRGRQFYFQGDLAAARREFDKAVDVLLGAPDTLPDHPRIERRLDQMCDLIYRFDIEKLGSGEKSQEQEAVSFDTAPIDEISHMTFPVDEKLAPKLETELNQTTSGIPLELSDPVLSYVHYFSTDRGRRILLAGLQRAGKYKPLIERIFAEEGVPQEFVYLAQAESGFLPRAVSRKSAVGMWQFIAGTGSVYNLERSSSIDERFDPEKATRAAAKYLKDLYARYGDWYLAMAAYNCGAGVVDRAVERTGYADYWELLKRHALPRETANYVPIILAMTIMAKNPQDYGLQDVTTDPALEYDSIHLTAATNLNLVADSTMQPVSVIRDLNPSLLRSVAPAGFDIHVPKGTADSAQTALDTVPAENRLAWRLHHVEAGDTIDTIAKAYHLPADRIFAVNHSADNLEAGDTLLIPAVYHEEPSVRKARSTTRKHSTSASSRSHKPSAQSATAAHVSASGRVPSRILNRKAAVRTASLGH